ncbi:MAG: hypothetical protein V7L11_29660 [Nostoc sp.]|uniref:hypothetical protein n=1 Tax=Nostoc sp. TaxID=1180 RepID=UPI002FF7A51B
MGLGTGDWGLGTGDWGLGTGDWGLGTQSENSSSLNPFLLYTCNSSDPLPSPKSQIPNPKSPVPNPQSLSCKF